MPSVILRTCPQCSRRFEATRSWHRFCNDICRSNHHREGREAVLRRARELGIEIDRTQANTDRKAS